MRVLSSNIHSDHPHDTLQGWGQGPGSGTGPHVGVLPLAGAGALLAEGTQQLAPSPLMSLGEVWLAALGEGRGCWCLEGSFAPHGLSELM